MRVDEAANGLKCKRSVWFSESEGKEPKECVCRNYEVKGVVKRKEAAWKEVLGAREEDAKERCMEAYKEENRKVKRCIYQSKKEVN